MTNNIRHECEGDILPLIWCTRYSEGDMSKYSMLSRFCNVSGLALSNDLGKPVAADSRDLRVNSEIVGSF